jgi:hypothetical protein
VTIIPKVIRLIMEEKTQIHRRFLNIIANGLLLSRWFTDTNWSKNSLWLNMDYFRPPCIADLNSAITQSVRKVL